MVDAATLPYRRTSRPDRATEAHATEPATSWAMVHRPGNAGLDSYEALCATSIWSPSQNARWVRSWAECAAHDYLIASLRIDGAPLFALALEVVTSRGLKVARYMGGSHANGNFPPACRQWLDSAEPADLRALVSAIRRARPDIDVIHLERQERMVGGHANPMLLLPSSESPNLAFSADVAAGFDAYLERMSGKRKRKKNRSQRRKFEEAGGFEIMRARTPDDVRELLDTFFLLKHQRLAAAGIEDVFDDAPTRNFMTRLFSDALADREPGFVLEGLKVGGILRAVSGFSIANGIVTCDFSTIREDELMQASPGDFLFYETIREACENGFRVYDFSVGDEPYKRLWCDCERTQFDTVIPLSRRGRIAALGMRTTADLKRFVKNNKAVWALVSRIRKGLARPAASVASPNPDDADRDGA